MNNTKIALKEVMKLAQHHLDNIDEEPDMESLNSIKNMVIGLNVGCECDDYNGFDCGCSNRNWIIDEAIKEIDSALANES